MRKYLTTAPSTVMLYDRVAQNANHLPLFPRKYVTARAYATNGNYKYGLTPRIKHACRLYASAAVATKKEAAEAVGLNPSYFNVITQPGHAKSMPEAIALIDEIQQRIEDKTVDLSAVVAEVSREALTTVRKLMKDSNNEAIKLKAASDILDRNPETSKTQKHQVAAFSLTGEDAKQLAAALVMGGRAAAEIGQIKGDFVRIPIDPDREEADTDAGQRLLTTALGQVHERRDLSAEQHRGEAGGGSEYLSEGEAPQGPASPEDAPQGSVIHLVKDEN